MKRFISLKIILLYFVANYVTFLFADQLNIFDKLDNFLKNEQHCWS